MLRELMSLFRSGDAMSELTTDFQEMMSLTRDLALRAGTVYFDGADDAIVEEVRKADVKVNKFERRIRKRLITHLTLDGKQADAPYCLLLMSLVKDVERLGDYSKNLAEVYADGGGPLPDDENRTELNELRFLVEETFTAAVAVFKDSDSATAVDLIREGRSTLKRCDALVSAVAGTDYGSATTVSMVLGARYYKRMQGHLLNILSGVVVPLHKLDYFDEDDLDAIAEED